MARKKRKVSPKVSERFGNRLDELQSIFSQKELAKRLGVSERTIRNYQNGTSAPDKKQRDKLNALYRKKKKDINPEKVQKRKKLKETKRANKKKQDQRPKLMSTQKWVNETFEETFIKQGILQDAPPFIYAAGDRGQFTDGVSPPGIPKGTKYVWLYGLYTSAYNKDGGEGKSDYIRSRLPITLRREMTLEEALDYVEGKFLQTAQQVGKRKLNPERFIGFEVP